MTHKDEQMKRLNQRLSHKDDSQLSRNADVEMTDRSISSSQIEQKQREYLSQLEQKVMTIAELR